MANHFQQNEKFDSHPCAEDTANHTVAAAANLSRQALCDVRVNVVDTSTTCGDVLPTCGFDPMSTKEQRQAYVREVAAPLFEGSPPLFAYLDRSSFKEGDNREFNGRVSVHNMNDFLKECQTAKETGQQQWPYTEKNAQYVRDLLDFKYPELTGENFAGFSARAVCRRAGMTHMSVKHYDDYAVLAENWKQARSEDASFSRDVQNSREIAAPLAPPAPPVADAPCVPVAPVEKPCPPVEKPCPPVEPPCPPVDAVIQHDRAVRSQIEDMSHFEKGGSYWRMANKFLHAGMTKCDVDDINNRDINRLTRDFVKMNHSTIDSRGLPNPMVHPGDRVPVPEHLAELAARHEKLARALERMMSAE